ncbi:MAG: formate dehydrogenase accessory protein FdhE [Hypericibacter sp.]
MAKTGAPRPDPTVIGEMAKPPFARLPELSDFFLRRARRFQSLAANHDLKPYLLFLANICAIQHGIQDRIPEVRLPAPERVARAKAHSMPPLDRTGFTPDATFDATLDHLLVSAATFEMPEAARAALRHVSNADAAARAEMVRSALEDSIPIEAIAEHLFVVAALQLHFARLAAQLDAKDLVPVGDGVCPACGGPVVSSIIVGWMEAQGTRFCACALCGTLWNYVRVKCTLCASTKGISYREIEGGAGTIKAEACDSCRSYVKILQQHKDPALDPVADDVASLGLDLLMRETELRRGGMNPFLLGY